MKKKGLPRLLVVDDEPLIIRAMTRALRGKVEVVGAQDGETALAHVRKGDVDVILAEASVLDPEGRSFVQRLEADHRQWLEPERGLLLSGQVRLPVHVQAHRPGDAHSGDREAVQRLVSAIAQPIICIRSWTSIWEMRV